ncbi:hypothetical protein E2493_12900 [Sphingomonas parva]|uniref:Uncharacterized protein n=1 Tax=Sphingomonas parva TaxID=2555898 RepID=A0A4Y8ZRG5_9SPHN|nr:hypothetical protein [Sphingomonas parva]TFI57882.1 hypothetical protein E2493_12900 [Sphingomonas parva]
MSIVHRSRRLRLPALAALLAAPAAAPAADLTVDAASDFVVEVTINGQPARLRVDPETPGFVIMNPDAIARLGIKPSLLPVVSRTGPVKLKGRTKVARIGLAGTSFERRLAWTERKAVDGADGLIGPEELPFDAVTFRWREGPSAASPVVLPLEFSNAWGLHHPYQDGGAVVRVQFSMVKPESLATASAGALLAASHGGRWTGEVASRMIEFDIQRPTRPMTLARPLLFDGFAIRGFRVRTGDHRGDYALPVDDDPDPNEIVVTATSPKRQKAVLVVTVGRERLSGCSRMTVRRKPRTVTLECPPDG